MRTRLRSLEQLMPLPTACVVSERDIGRGVILRDRAAVREIMSALRDPARGEYPYNQGMVMPCPA